MMGLTAFHEVTAITVLLSLLIAVIYRLLTKPGVMRKAKEDMKFFKAKLSEAQKAGDRAKANDYSSEMLKASQAQFRLGMKPMMVTMLVFVLLLGWLSSAYGGIVIDLSKQKDPRFAFAGASHNISYDSTTAGMSAGVDFNDDGAFSSNEIFAQGSVFSYGGATWRVMPVTEGIPLISMAPKANTIHFELLIARMPFTMPFIGDYLSWFWWYVFVSVPSTLVFRRLLGVE